MSGSDHQRGERRGPALIAALALCLALLLPLAWLAHGDSHGFDDGCDLCPALQALHHAVGPAGLDAMPPPRAPTPASRPDPAFRSSTVPAAVARGPPSLAA